MPTPRIDDANIEFAFTQEEARMAQILDPLKIAWLQTKYAAYWKLKNSLKVPEDPILDRSYFLQLAEYDGKLSAIQELLDGHKTALAEYNATKDQDVTQSGQAADTTAQRASQLVHIPHKP